MNKDLGNGMTIESFFDIMYLRVFGQEDFLIDDDGEAIIRIKEVVEYYGRRRRIFT